MYYDEALKKAERLRRSAAPTVLAIESSCDETAAAVSSGFEILGSRVHTQIPLHQKYGGVVPEIASRDHVRHMDAVVRGALDEAGLEPSALDAVAVTYGPGLVGALLTGVSWAKAFAYSMELPLYAINHIEGHICANYLAHPDLAPPYVCLVVSGGHSHIVMVQAHGQYRLIGRTRDDAAGEAFDKAARVLGIGYPGGPLLDKLAASGDPDAFPLPQPRLDGYDYTFSGLKTAMLQTSTRLERAGGYKKEDAAAAFQRSVTEQLADKAIRAALDYGATTLAVAGGVSANSGLRALLSRRCSEHGLRFCVPPVRLCTDNAEMIAAAAQIAIQNDRPAPLTLNAEPSLRLKML